MSLGKRQYLYSEKENLNYKYKPPEGKGFVNLRTEACELTSGKVITFGI